MQALASSGALSRMGGESGFQSWGTSVSTLNLQSEDEMLRDLHPLALKFLSEKLAAQGGSPTMEWSVRRSLGAEEDLDNSRGSLRRASGEPVNFPRGVDFPGVNFPRLSGTSPSGCSHTGFISV
mmetsp:Transcript_24201/g.57687  ORF Transcript_24201/g.57687 Transcript_24201/m.57687 type:complete len:124 (-) Transcript_24201:122-493(-)